MGKDKSMAIGKDESMVCYSNVKTRAMVFVQGRTKYLNALFVVATLFSLVSCNTNSSEVIKLENAKVSMAITPALGGRVLSLSLKGHDNLLKIGDSVESMPEPVVSAKAESIGYLGHINWVGPQSQWWAHQTLNTQRYEAKAAWPPDPYIVFAKNKILEQSSTKIVLEGAASPVSGLQIQKSFSLPDEDRAMVQLDVLATNIREENVSWDLWFNTRVHPSTQVYVPVANEEGVRAEAFNKGIDDPLEYSISDGVLSLDLFAPLYDKPGRQGKLFIQPSHGWIAGFNNGQVLIIEFPLQSLDAIHPEQGQIELYMNYQPGNMKDSLIEMEVHSPYLTLEPGQSMQASESWVVLPYAGLSSREAHIRYLKSYFAERIRGSNLVL